MKITKLLDTIDKFLGTRGNEFVSLDLGGEYIKCLLTKDSKIEDIFIEKNKGQGIKSALDLLTKHGLLSKEVRISLKGPDTLIRYIPFPKVDKSNLRESFTYELSKYIPFSPESVYFDIFTLDENYSKDEFLILLAAVKREFIDSLLRGFEEKRAKIAQITLNSLALMNLLFTTEKLESNLAIIDIGFSSTLLNLIRKDTPYLSRDIKLSGRNLLEKISKAKHLDKEEVEKILIDRGLEGEFSEIGEEVFFELSEEIKNSLDYFEMNVGEQIQNIYLTGGISAIKGIEKIMSTSLGLETKIWNFWNRLDVALPSILSFPNQMLGVVLGLSYEKNSH
jgi:type IV pilus assembly protein PilM